MAEPTLASYPWACAGQHDISDQRDLAAPIPVEFDVARRLPAILHSDCESKDFEYQPPSFNPAPAPPRRNGDCILPSIPVEVYLAILDHLKASYRDKSLAEYKAILSSLCLVCRMFCEELQRILFRGLAHEGDFGSRTRTLSRYRVWARMIELQDPRAMRLASLVRELDATLRHLPHPSTVKPHDYDLGTSFPAVVPHLRSLQRMSISHCIFTGEAFAAFAQLPNLSAVSLDACELEHGCAPVPELATWTSLSVTHTNGVHNWLSTFSRLVDVDNLQYLCTDDWRLAVSLLETRLAPRLSQLRIDAPCPDTSSLPATLFNAPNLTSLTISSEKWTLTNALLETAAPHLTHLTAHPEAAAHLVPGRPVRSLTLLWPEHVLRARTLHPRLTPPASAAPLTTLSIPSRCVPWLRPDDFPALQTLVLRPLCGARARAAAAAVWKTSRWEPFACGHVPPAPVAAPTTVVYALDHACCAACAALALALDHQRRFFVDEAAPRFPRAAAIRFGAAVEWRRRRGDAAAGDAWAPHVVERAVVRGLLLAGQGAAARVHGCLRAVLGDEARGAHAPGVAR